MTAVYFDVSVSDDERRPRLYDDDLFVYSATPATPELRARARGMIGTAFAPHDLLRVHEILPVEQCVRTSSHFMTTEHSKGHIPHLEATSQ